MPSVLSSIGNTFPADVLEEVTPVNHHLLDVSGSFALIQLALLNTEARLLWSHTLLLSVSRVIWLGLIDFLSARPANR